MTAGPLDGLRVLDFSRVLAGPWATQVLGDLGAQVLRIEQPGHLDQFRVVPPHLETADGQRTWESALYLSTNRNKQSVSIDVSKPEGAALVHRIATACDIVVENFRPGYLQRRGLGYEDLVKTNPRLIYCSISGFGQDGPYRDRAGYDSTFQAISGMMSFTGQPDGQPGDGPMRTGPSFCDFGAAMYAVTAILAALYHRTSTGRGQYLDVSMMDTTLAMISHHAMSYLVTGDVPARVGNDSPFAAPIGLFRCADQYVTINAALDHTYEALCDVLQAPELKTDPRFVHRLRPTNRAVLREELEPRIARWTAHDLLAALSARGVPCAPINDIDQALADPQVLHRGMVRDLPHPLAGTLRTVASPLRFSAAEAPRSEPPPLLGEHTDDALRELLGLSDVELARLRAAGVIGPLGESIQPGPGRHAP